MKRADCSVLCLYCICIRGAMALVFFCKGCLRVCRSLRGGGVTGIRTVAALCKACRESYEL
jgi:hypothetical protein